MALCDQLEAQLTTTEADSRRLLEAVLHEALAPASGGNRISQAAVVSQEAGRHQSKRLYALL